MKRFVLVLVFLCILPLAASAAGKVDEPSPAFIGEDLHQAPFNLSKELGKVVIVSFWATWCVPCREEMPILEAFYQKYHSRGLEILAVSLDKGRKRDAVVAALKSFSFPGVMAEDASVNEFGRPSELPIVYLIDRKGTVRTIFTSETTQLTTINLEDALNPLIGSERESAN